MVEEKKDLVIMAYFPFTFTVFLLFLGERDAALGLSHSALDKSTIWKRSVVSLQKTVFETDDLWNYCSKLEFIVSH